MTKPYPSTQKIVYSVPFLADELSEFDLWFFTGSKCVLECSHCYVESSPVANKHPPLSFETFQKHLESLLSRNYKKLEIYFTGGEPFVNPELIKMIEVALKHANTTVLTNAIRIDNTRATRLMELHESSKYELTFRVSFDGSSEELNDTIRGKKAFKRAKSGLNNLLSVGFNPIITIMRRWKETDFPNIKAEFNLMLKNIGIPLDKQRIKILPPLRIGREAVRDRPYTNQELFTEQCFNNYDFYNLQCSRCRMVSENGIWVCPILINVDSGFMGRTMEKAVRSFPMTSMACWTCRMDGLSCTND